MINKIVFPYDFSKFSTMAENYVSECSKLGVKEIIIVHVVEYEELFTNVLFKENEIRKLKQDAEERLSHVKNNLRQKGLSVHTVIDFGIPSKIILKVAEKEKADLIIIGAQGRSAAMDFLLGSTALNVLRRSKIPVMIIPNKSS